METEKDIRSQETTAVKTNIYYNGLCILSGMHTFFCVAGSFSQKLMPSDILMALSIDKFYEQMILKICVEGLNPGYHTHYAYFIL